MLGISPYEVKYGNLGLFPHDQNYCEPGDIGTYHLCYPYCTATGAQKHTRSSIASILPRKGFE